MDPATIATIAKVGAQIFGAVSGGKQSKQASNVQADFQKHTGLFWDVVQSAVSNYPEITQDDIPYLTQRLEPLSQKLQQNPYAYEGEGYFKARYGTAFKDGATISNFNVVIRSEIDNYLDQKSKGAGQQMNQTSVMTLGTGLQQPTTFFSGISDIFSQANLALKSSVEDIAGIKSSINSISQGNKTTAPEAKIQPNWMQIALVGGGVILLIFFIARKK